MGREGELLRKGLFRELFIRRYGEGGGVIARGRIERAVYSKVWEGRGSYFERAYLESCLLEGMGREGELFILREGVLRELFIGRYGEGGAVIARGRIERSCLLEGMGREGELLREGVLRELFIRRYGEGGGVIYIARGRIERVVYWKVWGGRGSYCERAY